MSTVTERGLLMTAESVRATIEGRKTQTRRVVKLPKYATPDNAWPATYEQRMQDVRETFPNGPADAWAMVVGDEYEGQRLLCNRTDDVGIHVAACPHGQPGDRLWVRETMREDPGGGWVYAADNERVELDEDDPRVPAMISWAFHQNRDYCVSIHMPRWASRLTLELTGVRVERVQDISEDDAKAEGSPRMANVQRWDPIFGTSESVQLRDDGTHRAGFHLRWDILNAKRGYGWDVNPWVWVLSFTRLKP